MARQKWSKSAGADEYLLPRNGVCLLTKIVQIVIERILANCSDAHQRPQLKRRGRTTTHISCPISRKPSNRKDAKVVALRRHYREHGNILGDGHMDSRNGQPCERIVDLELSSRK